MFVMIRVGFQFMKVLERFCWFCSVGFFLVIVVIIEEGGYIWFFGGIGCYNLVCRDVVGYYLLLIVVVLGNIGEG